ncbi:MAG TPA: hypothetical protein DEQ02_03890 [Ruminococcaceae bacterium]|nr:hypothetical protein [Oscillospiraceae bacterium]
MIERKIKILKKLMLCVCALLCIVFAAGCGNNSGPIDGVEIRGSRVIQTVEEGELKFVNTYGFQGDTVVSFQIEITSENLHDSIYTLETTYKAMGFTIIESDSEKLVVEASETLVEEYAERYDSKQALAESLRENAVEGESSDETSEAASNNTSEETSGE